MSEREHVRADGRVERVCAHGVGHPVGHVKAWQTWMGVHGCDGCCAGWPETKQPLAPYAAERKARVGR
jgi:hypothetical protein